MARLPYVPDPANGHGASTGTPPGAGSSLASDAAAVYAEIRALGRPVLNLYRALANQPPALRAFLGMSRYVRDRSSLPPRLRELAILATAYALDVPYEQDHHIAVARQVGVRDEQLA